jgi:hypothetical protein
MGIGTPSSQSRIPRPICTSHRKHVCSQNACAPFGFRCDCIVGRQQEFGICRRGPFPLCPA